MLFARQLTCCLMVNKSSKTSNESSKCFPSQCEQMLFCQENQVPNGFPEVVGGTTNQIATELGKPARDMNFFFNLYSIAYFQQLTKQLMPKLQSYFSKTINDGNTLSSACVSTRSNLSIEHFKNKNLNIQSNFNKHFPRKLIFQLQSSGGLAHRMGWAQ